MKRKKKIPEKSLGARIAEGMEEAVAFMRDDADMSKYRVHTPAAIDTRAVRRKLELTARVARSVWG